MSDAGLGSTCVQDNSQGNIACLAVPSGSQVSDSVDLIRLSRIAPTDLIAVTGPGGLELLGALCRSGHEQVVCVSSGVPSVHEQVDAILMAGHRSVDAMMRSLVRVAPHLKEGGVLACELPTFEDDRRVELCLASLGLAVESTVFDLRSKVLVRHTIGHEARLLRAA